MTSRACEDRGNAIILRAAAARVRLRLTPYLTGRCIHHPPNLSWSCDGGKAAFLPVRARHRNLNFGVGECTLNVLRVDLHEESSLSTVDIDFR